MIRSKGEAGTGDIVEAVRHLRAITGEIRRLGDARRRRSSRPPPRSYSAPLDLVRGVASDGQAAGAAVLRRRHRHAGRRVAGDAARRRGRLRRLGHLQVRGPGRRARAAIVEATTHFADPERVADASRGPRPGDGVARGAQARRDAAARQPRLVARRGGAPSIGVLALQGGFAAHARMLRALGAEVREVRTPADLDGLDGLVMPGGESTTMTLGIEREGLAEPLRALARRGHAGARHLRRADHARPRAPRAHGHRWPSATRSGARCTPSRRTSTFPDVDGGPVRAVFIRAPWIAEHGPGVEILAAVDGHPVAARQGDAARPLLPPRAGRRRAAARGVPAARHGAAAAAAAQRRDGA